MKGALIVKDLQLDNELVHVEPARYAKNMLAVRVRSTGTQQGWKARMARLLGALKARYSNREHAYIVSPTKLARAEQLYRDGWDGSLWGELEPPDKDARDSAGSTPTNGGS